jgi:hypothetical protein
MPRSHRRERKTIYDFTTVGNFWVIAGLRVESAVVGLECKARRLNKQGWETAAALCDSSVPPIQKYLEAIMVSAHFVPSPPADPEVVSLRE